MDGWPPWPWAPHRSCGARLGLSAFALALLLAGAEPEELATVITASARGVDRVAFGDVIGANAAIVTVALGVGALVTTMPFGPRIRRYGVGGLAAAAVAGPILWDGSVGRIEGAVLVAGYAVFVASIWRAERQPPSPLVKPPNSTRTTPMVAPSAVSRPWSSSASPR